jgi:hypothetical protein
MLPGEGTPAQSAASTLDSPISWDVPPGDGTLFPPEVLRAPAEVIAGYPFPVTVFTVGPNGCWSPDGIDIKIGTSEVELLPWDLHTGADACTMIFGYLAHDTILTLQEAGEWTLRVEGRRIRGDGSVDGSVKAERKVVVHPASNVPSPAEIELAPGEEILVDGILRVLFMAVEEDSRCPVDVQCVWQGNAAVRIALTSGSGPSHPALLNTGVDPTKVEFGGYRISLFDLTPKPLSTSTIPAGAYRASLGIERLATP